jgi:hypothetical protein
MTYNIKLGYKSAKFAYANRSTNINIDTGAYTDVQYGLTTLSGSTGLQATLSNGNIILADNIYHGFFYPMAGGQNVFSMSIFINNTSLVTQSKIFKETAIDPVSTGHITRSLPLFFSYVATAGDVLSIRYTKTSSQILDIYSGSVGTNLFLMEVAK